MTGLIAEFSGWNSFELKRAFTEACQYVSEQGGVEIVDAMYANADARADVALAVYAAHYGAIFDEPCTSALGELVQRQVDNISMALGVAATGESASDRDAISLATSLGAPPAGSIREIVASPGLRELYGHIVHWLEIVVASRPRQSYLGNTLARDADETMTDNLPTSSTSPANPIRLRSRL